MRASTVSTVFALLILFCCSGCVTSYFNERRQIRSHTVEHAEFSPHWVLLEPSGGVAIEGTCNQPTSNTPCFTIIGRIAPRNSATTKKDEIVKDINKRFANDPNILCSLNTIQWIDSGYTRIERFPSSLPSTIYVNEHTVVRGPNWNMVWTVPVDIATSPIQLILFVCIVTSFHVASR